MTTLIRAFNEWSNRPADQRFSSLADLHATAAQYKQQSQEAVADTHSLRAVPVLGDVQVTGASGVLAKLTHWAFGQFARKAGAPAAYLRTLPAGLAADCINEGIVAREHNGERETALLFNAGESGLTARAMLTPAYERVWNADITKRLIALEETGNWHPAPAAFDGSRGLYLSEHDLFAFMVDSERRIFESLPGGGLGRGFFAWNSEVGASSFGISTFLYEFVCGNHRVWGAQNIKEVRFRHVGQANAKAFHALAVELQDYADASVTEDEAAIKSARSYVLGGTKDEVLDRVFNLRVPALTRVRATEAYDKAVEREDWYGNPHSAWGFAGGLTEIARDIPYADERVALDRAAGKVMNLAR